MRATPYYYFGDYFRRLVKLRKSELALVYGRYALVEAANPDVYAYTRSLGQQTFLVLLNFRAHESSVNPAGLKAQKMERVLGNYGTISAALHQLRPYEAAIYRIAP